MRPLISVFALHRPIPSVIPSNFSCDSVSGCLTHELLNVGWAPSRSSATRLGRAACWRWLLRWHSLAGPSPLSIYLPRSLRSRCRFGGRGKRRARGLPTTKTRCLSLDSSYRKSASRWCRSCESLKISSGGVHLTAATYGPPPYPRCGWWGARGTREDGWKSVEFSLIDFGIGRDGLNDRLCYCLH